MIRRLREPLLHFVVAGIVLFTAYSVVQYRVPAADSQTIVLDACGILVVRMNRERLQSDGRPLAYARVGFCNTESA